MNDRSFAAPVYVKDGKHLIQEIQSLDDALDFLDEWPLNRRGPIYETALRACHRAYSRDVSPGMRSSASPICRHSPEDRRPPALPHDRAKYWPRWGA